MHKLGLDAQWIQLAMETVHIASYSILINGRPLITIHFPFMC